MSATDEPVLPAIDLAVDLLGQLERNEISLIQWTSATDTEHYVTDDLERILRAYVDLDLACQP